jgi:2'-5' RNA ligase
MPEQLKQYWLVGEGAAKVRWGTPGSFERCVRNLRDDFPQNPEGLCANLYHEATGRWPGQDRNKGAVEHTGAMIALIPAVHDAGYMSVPDGEPVEELHVTLAYLGEADAWDPDVRAALLEAMSQVASGATPVSARAFGVAHWNPDSDSPAWVYSLSDDGEANSQTLTDVHSGVMRQLYDFAQARDLVPVQHSPWVAHMTGIYDSNDRREEMSAKLGPVTFDRLRVAFAGDHVDFPLGPEACDGYEDLAEETVVDIPKSLPWSTPGDAALAFENEQTGDGRVFAPGALYWDGSGPWPLQYADEMQGGHDGAELAGEINSLGRDGNRIPGSGKLYLTLAAGVEAAMLLDQHSPLGVSVDLDDVDLEMVDTQPGSGGTYRAKLLNASVLPAASGGYHLVGQTVPTMAASGLSMVTESRTVSFIIPADGMVPGEAIDLVAAAGDPDFTDGTVVDSTRSGQYLMRITRARVRGATLVSIPAFANARIVLDEQSPFNQPSGPVDEATAAIQSVTDYDRVLRHVRRSSVPVGAARLAQALKMPVVAAQRMLATAASRGEVVRLTRGLYTDKTTSAKADHVMLDDMVASVTGQVDLPVADRDTEWDGAGAADRVFTWADGDASKIGRAFAYRDDDKDPLTKAAYKLGYADVLDGQLTIVPKGVSAALGALNGARGGVDLPADERAAVRERLDSVAAHVDEVTGEDMAEEMHASAWAALKDAPAFRAEWFREPTIEELPPGGPGVNYADGRIFGWVAQAGEAHAGFAKKVTIDGLGRIDTTHFLRQRFTLDDGSTVKAGAYTMNVGHHRDGAECETSSCQFDDTRTVAGIVTVGMNERGMWFSGAAAPWLSEWDRAVFQATQPSYHMKKAPGGGWQLRAVLAVPVPGHSSPLLASAVVGRAQMALTAAATLAEANDAVVAEQAFRDAAEKDTQGIDYDRLADSLVAAFARAEQRKADEAAELAELLAMADTLDVDITGTEGN